MSITKTSSPPIASKSEPELISVELSARRTGMSFQRTRMSADRTLMSVIRTSLSLIGFRFHDLSGVPKALRCKNPSPRPGAAQLRYGAGAARYHNARCWHRISREVHAGTAAGAPRNESRRADSRREPIPGLDDADRRCSVAVGRPIRDCQYGVQRRTVRVGSLETIQ